MHGKPASSKGRPGASAPSSSAGVSHILWNYRPQDQRTVPTSRGDGSVLGGVENPIGNHAEPEPDSHDRSHLNWVQTLSAIQCHNAPPLPIGRFLIKLPAGLCIGQRSERFVPGSNRGRAVSRRGEGQPYFFRNSGGCGDGSGIGRFMSMAVAIHSAMASCAFANA